MTRLYFETRDEAAELRGWEYHWLGGLADNVARGMLAMEAHYDGWDDLINPAHYLGRYVDRKTKTTAQWCRQFETALRQDSFHVPLLVRKGRRISGWGLMLNTAVAVGGDAVKLAARLYSQAELHAWIAEDDRRWVADIIEHALATGVYRESQVQDGNTTPSGWRSVVSLLRDTAGAPGPVVTHYSIFEDFPGPHVIDNDVTAARWEDYNRTEHWDMAVRSLTKGAWSRRYTGLQIKPDDWDSFRFHHSLTIMDMYAADRDARIYAALSQAPVA